MSIEEIEKEIAVLEQGDTNWNSIQRLSWLYVVHDHLASNGTQKIVREIKSIMPEYSGEFGKTVSGVSIDDLMNILSEHMSVIKVLHPKEYQAVLDRISELKY